MSEKCTCDASAYAGPNAGCRAHPACGTCGSRFDHTDTCPVPRTPIRPEDLCRECASPHGMEHRVLCRFRLSTGGEIVTRAQTRGERPGPRWEVGHERPPAIYVDGERPPAIYALAAVNSFLHHARETFGVLAVHLVGLAHGVITLGIVATDDFALPPATGVLMSELRSALAPHVPTGLRIVLVQAWDV